MGTRGIYGIKSGDKLCVSYNHWDSYPGGLGEDILRQIFSLLNTYSIYELKSMMAAMKMVDEQDKPTEEEIEELADLSDTTVGEGTTQDWYCLLRKIQGDLGASLKCGYMIDSLHFAADSLFCEWGYLLDLDRMKLQVYRGFQQQPHKCGEFADMPPKDYGSGNAYYPIALMCEVDLIQPDVQDVIDDLMRLTSYSDEDEEENSLVIQ